LNVPTELEYSNHNNIKKKNQILFCTFAIFKTAFPSWDKNKSQFKRDSPESGEEDK